MAVLINIFKHHLRKGHWVNKKTLLITNKSKDSTFQQQWLPYTQHWWLRNHLKKVVSEKILDTIECLNQNVLTDFTSNECETNQKTSRSFFFQIRWIFVTSTICLLLVFYAYIFSSLLNVPIISYQIFMSFHF
jgi:hypothetical protein